LEVYEMKKATIEAIYAGHWIVLSESGEVLGAGLTKNDALHDYEKGTNIQRCYCLLVGHPDFITQHTVRAKRRIDYQADPNDPKLLINGVSATPVDKDQSIPLAPMILDTGSAVTQLDSPNIRAMQLPSLSVGGYNSVQLKEYRCCCKFLGKRTQELTVTKHNRLYPGDAGYGLAGLNFVYPNFVCTLDGPSQAGSISNPAIHCQNCQGCTTQSCVCYEAGGKCESSCRCTACSNQ